MRVAFVGKGGSGKTTLSSLFAAPAAARRPGGRGRRGHQPAPRRWRSGWSTTLPRRPLGAHLTEIKDYLRGDNPRISSAAAMVKTTPPGRGSRLLRLGGTTRSTAPGSASRSGADADGHRAVRRGGPRAWPATTRRSGRSSSTSTTWSTAGRVRRGRHDRRGGLVRLGAVHPVRPDLPGRRAHPAGRRRLPAVPRATPRTTTCRSRVVGNKVHGPGDVAFLRDHVGDDLLGWLEQSARSARWSRAAGSASTTWSRPTAPRSTPCCAGSTSRPRTGSGSAGRRCSSTCATPRRGRTGRPARTCAAQIDPGFVFGPVPAGSAS